jgi:hypothetical protein
MRKRYARSSTWTGTVTLRKYREIEEVEAPDLAGSPADHLRAVFDLIALCNWLGPYDLRRGLRRFRSLNSRGRTRDRIYVRTAADRDRRSRITGISSLT